MKHVQTAVLLATFGALAASWSAPIESTKPAGIDDLGLWLRAGDLETAHQDGQPIRLWPDRSANGYDAIYEPRIPQAGLAVGLHQPPTLKSRAVAGQAAVSFNASNRESLILNRAGHALGQKCSGFTAIFLVRPSLTYGKKPAPDAAWTKNRYLFLTHVSDYNSRFSLQIVEDSGEVKLFTRPVPTQKRVTQTSSFDQDDREKVTGDRWQRVMGSVDYQAKVARIVINGKILTRALPPESASVSEDVPSPITGIASTTLGDWLTCDIAEVLCYNRALSVDELLAVDSYLCTKYRLTE